MLPAATSFWVMSMQSNRWLGSPWLWCTVWGLSGALALGCSQGNRNAPVQAEKARETLRAALESWKKGDRVDALQSAAPPIYVIDTEWQGGAKLKDYQIVSDGDEKDAHLYCPVKLTLQDRGGQEVKKEVIYIISTAPNLTVSRKVF
jgi:hypothetical protein